MSSPEFGEQQQAPIAWEDFINAQLEGGNINLPPVHGHVHDSSRLEGDIPEPEVEMFGEPVIDVRTFAASQRGRLAPAVRANALSQLANEGAIVRGTFSLQATQPGYYPFINADTTQIYDDKRMDTELLLKLPVAVDPQNTTLHNDVVQAAAAKRGMLRFVADVQVIRDDSENVVAQVRNVYAAERPYAGAGDTLPWPGDSVIMQGQVTHYNPGSESDFRDPGSITVYSPEMGEQTIDTQPVGPLSFSHDIRADRTVSHLHDAPKQGDEVQVRAFRTQTGEWSISPNVLGFVQKSKQVEAIRLLKAGDESALGTLEQYDTFATQMAELRQAVTPEEARTLHAALMRHAINPDKYARRQQPYVLTPDQLAQVQDFAQSFETGTADYQRSIAMRRELAENHDDILSTVLEVEAALKKDILGMTFTEFAKAVEDYASGNYDIDPSEAYQSTRFMDLARNLSSNLYNASMFTFYGRGIATILGRTPNTGPGTGVISAADGQVLQQLLTDPEPHMRAYQAGTYTGRFNARRLDAYSRIVDTLSNESLQEYGLDSTIAGRMAGLLKQPFKQQTYHQGPPQMEDFAVVQDRRLLQVVLDLAPGIIARLRQNIDSKPLPEDPQHRMHEVITKQRQQVANLENAMILIQQRQ